MVKPYLNALLKEIEQIARLGDFESISSIYFGGGTPTLMVEHFGDLLEHLSKFFKIEGDIFIETSPYDITEEKLRLLKKYGFSGISLGVQSFQDKFLRSIGRKYTSKEAYHSIELTKKYFDNINIDLMFALPNEMLSDWEFDLKEALRVGVEQITAYPLFTFPYSSVGKFKNIREVKVPNFLIRKKMFEMLYDYSVSSGYQPVSVWGFKKGEHHEYSSVTRGDYIGFGAGAGTKVPGWFYLNTFDVDHYIKKINQGNFAEVVKMDFTEKMDNLFWLYWRIYETRIPKEEFQIKFEKDKKVKFLVNLLKLFGMACDEGNYIQLTKRGMFYVHLLQNQFALNYIEKVWSRMLAESEPDKISLD